MAMVNIPSTCDDPQYRYKMPRLMTKKEGRGNGSKTCIVNMTDVARALKRPPQYTTKWFGSELGAQSTYTNKEGEGERAIVNGHHDTPIFQTMLDKFIDTYVLCQNCRLPEIDMNVKKGLIVAKCKACGWSGELDNNHKLAAFVTKNPPDESGHGIVNLAAGDTGTKKSKDDRRKEREEKRKAKAEQGEGGEDDEDDEDEEAKAERRRERKERREKKEKKEGTSEKKERREKKEKREKADGEEGEEGEDGEDGEKKERREKKEKKDRSERKEKKDRSERKEKKDRSERKEKKDRSERKSKKEEAASDDDDEDGSQDGKGKAENEDDVEYDGEIAEQVIGVMKDFIGSKSGQVNPEDFFEELRMQQLAKLFDHKIRFYIALEALFPAGSMDAKAVVDNKKVIDLVLSKVTIPAKDILWSFNAYLSLEKNEKAVRSYPMVLKAIYDEEWAGEEDILKYYVQEEGAGEPGFEKANTAATPFLKWLQTAEESDDDDDDDDDEDDD